METYSLLGSSNYTPLQDTIFAEKHARLVIPFNRKHGSRILALISLFILLFISYKIVAGNKASKPNNSSPVIIVPNKQLSPTESPEESPTPRIVRSFFAPTTRPTLTATPGPTSTPTPGPTNTPTPNPTCTPPPHPTSTPTPRPTATPTPLPDLIPPVITSMDGPANGETITVRDFCFTLKITDNVSHYPNIWTQYQFNSILWTDWSNDQHTAYNICFSNVADGEHIFTVHAKDEAGNISLPESRDFKVSTEY